MKIGAQFFTLRDFCKNTDDFAESLKKVADIGYRYVQISGVCEYDAQWLSEQLAKNGLECVLTHISPDMLKSDINKVIDNHNIFNCKHVGLGWMPFEDGKEEERFDEMVSSYKPVAKALKDAGKYFMYHNHAHEFKKIGDMTILEKLSEAFSPDEMGFTLDTYWVQVGGGDPARWIEKFSGRVPCIHLKDCAYGPKMAVVGEGNINFDRVFEKAESAGTQYMLVEQDNCNGEDPFACLERSYKNLKSFGFN